MAARIPAGASPPIDVGLPERYPLVRRIASGGMATVWCAQDAVLGREVAIKLLADPYLRDRGSVLRFKREARAAARLSGHTNVVTIFDVGQTRASPEAPAGRPYIVMEYLSGGTVAGALRAGSHDRDEMLRWLREAAAALDYAHGRGVIHRDIKPANLLLDSDRVLHVGDFGIARVGAEDTITSNGELFGTAAYISPEQARGRSATEASDRYALAVVAFEMLVGERPFSAELFAAQARQHVDEPPPRASSRNPELPRAVDAVLARGLAKQPEERWPTASEFAAALSDALRADAQPTRVLEVDHRPRAVAPAAGAAAGAGALLPPRFAEPPRRRRPTFPRVRSRPRAAAVAALAAMAVAVAVILAAGHGKGRPLRAAQAPRRPSAIHPASPPGRRASTNHHRTVTPAGATSSSPNPAAQGVPTPTTAAGSSSADALEAQGHGLMAAGNYGAAVGVLRQAVQAADPSSTTYAYALYDLGRSLRLAGDPRAAAVVLQQRLQIPNQTEVVRQELQLALQAAGAQVNASGGAPSASTGSGGAPAGGQPIGHAGKGQGQGGQGGQGGGGSGGGGD